jgi:elongation factor Ts
MAYTAADVKRLRDLTQAGMMDCKKALDEAGGDFDKAVEILRVKGAAKAAARAAEREASAGLVAASGNALISLKAETDFVAKNAACMAAAQAIAEAADTHQAGDTEALKAISLGDKTVGDTIAELARTIGEKIELGQVAYFDGNTTVYLHKKATDLPPSLGVLVEFEGDEAAAKQAAQQAAALKAQYLRSDQVPADVVAAEKDVLTKKTIEEGKPEAAVGKIVEGRINAFFKEIVLLDQESVFDPKKSVKQLLDAASTTVTRFARFEVGA